MKNLVFTFIVLLGVLIPKDCWSQTIITQDIATNTTWDDDGSPYVLSREVITVNEGATLTIKPNVVVKFGDWRTVFQIDGNLIADGRTSHYSSNPTGIIFTSYKDDLHGGDTNGNGVADMPAPGDWKSIVISETGYAEFKQCLFLYGGDNFGNPMLQTFNEIDTIYNCRFAESYYVPVRALGASLNMDNCFIETGNGVEINNYTGGTKSWKKLILTNNSFKGVYTPIQAAWGDGVYIHLKNNKIKDPTSSSGDANACTIFGTFYGDNVFEGEENIPFVFSNLQIDTSASLTLPPGTIVKFDNYSKLFVHGRLNAKGDLYQPIVFTSVDDDQFGGDTNGDGNATQPARRLWSGVDFEGMGSSVLENVIFKYAGDHSDGFGAINITDHEVTFTDCVFAENGKSAISLIRSDSKIMGCTFSDNSQAIYIDNVSLPTIRNNDFMLNTLSGAALQVDNYQNPNVADVEDNYWASTKGPSVQNGQTTNGDRIVGPADFEPYKTSMINDHLVEKPKIAASKSGNQIICKEGTGYVFEDQTWDMGDGTTLMGNSVTHTYATQGVYEVCLTATSSYGVKVKQCKDINSTTGTEDVKASIDQWSAYPSPSQGNFTLSFVPSFSGEVQIRLLGTNGQINDLMYQGDVHNDLLFSKTFDVDVTPGVYLIAISMQGQRIIKKIVIQ